MYTVAKRLSALGSLALSAAMALAAAVALTSLVLPMTATGTVQLHSLQVQRAQDFFTRKEVEVCDLLINLDADIDGLFHWNTKHVYLSLVVEYSSARVPYTQTVLWDLVVNGTQPHRIELKNHRPKFALADGFFGLRGAKLNASVHWDIVPYAGALLRGNTEPVTFAV
eukprot:Unigene11553_Nuclearia_a/m.35213 Unigene11553_Nuclearia_a/g.35213  ORF Unigene11553_Nuclearia_a/g.35213 Unigene11553_Nuclearia_a/m.35213 type:complete len:168 (-) Unigene11553_Nuclearia_a:26-529(-)